MQFCNLALKYFKMYRTHNCGDLSIKNINQQVSLCGWVQKTRDLGGLTFIDLRDFYGITQLTFNMDVNKELCLNARNIGREFVIKISGIVVERESKNTDIKTGEIEIDVKNLEILNPSKTPPFTIENNTDGGDDLRMKYRYLDIRRNEIKHNLTSRAKLYSSIRNYLNKNSFCEIETPYLIKSTPEGARDFLVPSRMNKHQFYALPQSPQTFKQLLMVGGIDRYYQIVKCFRDEDLRSDRQPEFTQLDCEMAFVNQEDVINTFENLIISIFKELKNITLLKFPRITYENAIRLYGTDKPDIRFQMLIHEITHLTKNKGFKPFEEAESVVAINVSGGALFSRKEIDEITRFIKTPQIGADGLIYCKYNSDGTSKSSVDKFFDHISRDTWKKELNAKNNDMIFIMAGDIKKIRKSMGALRLHIAKKLGLLDSKLFCPLWVIDFPLFEFDDETKKYHSIHHPFTSPKESDLSQIINNPKQVKANAYDLVINGNEIGGGSIRIHEKSLQKEIFKILGFTEEEAKNQFGFLMDAFEYGAPPHGGIAFGFDRLISIMNGKENIRDFIAFPKNNSGRDVMIDSPSFIDDEQIKDLGLKRS